MAKASSSRLGKSEMNLVKQYCSRVSDEDLAVLVDLLPQKVAFDRSSACAILQKDKEVDRWLSQAAGAEDWFIKVDGIGDQAILEMEARSKKK